MNDLADEPCPGLAPFSLRDAPSFIERQFPVGRLSAEAYKERDAGQGQTLTALGSFWKGRKPLILVRAVVLGCLLPATDDVATDFEVFLKLMAIDDLAFGRRFDGNAARFARLFPDHAEELTENKGRLLAWRGDLTQAEHQLRVAEVFATMPYKERIKHVRRPEECDLSELLGPIWHIVFRHLATTAHSFPALVEQLGIARFGHRPKVADVFCGSGQIPFEAARMGCDAYASDLNPIASLLTWGAFNIVGATASRFAAVEAAKARLASAVEAEITRLAIEQDAAGNRAKAYLYCLETRCPRTDWAVPMAPSWVISRTRNTVARLIPNPLDQRYEIEIHSGVSAQDMMDAERGTVVGDRLVHTMNPEPSGIEIKTIRGDYRDANGVSRNRLRPWDRADFVPRPADIFQERLYCVQWITRETLERGRQETFFAGVTGEDVARERQVEGIVGANLADWQARGLVPTMPIQPGEETTRLLRERGWTHWHHLFGPRHLLIAKTVRELANEEQDEDVRTALLFVLNYILDKSGRLASWRVGSPGRPGRAPSADAVEHVFYNQTFNTFYNFGARALPSLNFRNSLKTKNQTIKTRTKIETKLAVECNEKSDIFVTDPPYADSIHYHEITEYFISWLHTRPPAPIATWTWESRRDLAIQGADEKFRREMVAAYTAIAKCMPANGLQVVMFTHQDAGVWADLGAIVWAAGFSVTAAWNVATEIGKPSGKGNYVQGTINLVLRKRQGDGNARRMEIEAEIETAVAEQLARLNALDDAWHERGGAETLYTDGDLTLAAYAAALQVVTAYSTIDRQPLDRDLYRKLAKKERTMLRELIEYAASVANTLLVPEGFPRPLWRDLAAPERFYVRMLDMEAQGSAKVADFQAFARSFAFAGYSELMASIAANAAALAGAADLKGRLLDGDGFAASVLRQVLFAVWKTMESGTPEPRRGLLTLKTEYTADYWQRRQTLIALADYVALKTARTRPAESQAAQELAEALRNDRV